MIIHRIRTLAAAVVAAWLVLPLLPSSGVAAPPCGVPIDADAGWTIATQDAAGFDAERLCALDRKLDDQALNVHGVVVARGGKLVYEAYRAGADYKLMTDLGVVTYSAAMQHDVKSVTKSVVSLLFGIALERKLIPGIDAPVLSFFPDYADLRTPEKDRILLSHVLTMSSGLEWDEDLPYTDPKNAAIRMVYAPDPYRFVLEQKVVAEPGKVWAYNSGGTQLLAGVLQKATGKPIADFARDALFAPLGIGEFEWMPLPGGEAAAGWGLRLRPRDMAKIAQLVLNKGAWDGRQIVSAAWIAESTKPRQVGWGGHGYGYQWWGGQSPADGKGAAWIAGWGLGGQRIFIVPDHDLVVAITAGLYQSDQQDDVTQGILDDVVAALRQ
jgi:CubicO group peptidase (beta-lactamase class C family)